MTELTESALSPEAAYGQAILREIPRVLSLMDREPYSPTLGCCDRTYWAWKFIDFPAPRFQESLCVLSFVHSTDFPGNEYYQRPALLEWIGGGLRYWVSRQHRDGCFDEAYPYERSLAATAFTSVYVSEALQFLGDALDRQIRGEVEGALGRAGDWLVSHDETHGVLSNHLAAAALACLHIHRISREQRHADRGGHFVNRILERQSAEGWYEEYGGPDPGYQTHGTFYLARYLELGVHEGLEESLRTANNFLAYFVHPDGSLGGEYASRNTKTYYPAGFEMLAQRDETARWIAEHMRPSLFNGSAAALHTVDAYNFFPFLNNFVFAFLASSGNEGRGPAADPTADGRTEFPLGGLVRYRTPAYDACVSTVKGGMIKVFDRSRRMLAYSDSGYAGRTRAGGLVATQQDDASRSVEVAGETIRVNGSCAVVSRPTLTPMTFLGFRAFSLTVGRLPVVAQWFKRLIVKVLIHRRRDLGVRWTRTITFHDTSIDVRDDFEAATDPQIEELRWAPVFATVHMGSARYFVTNELARHHDPAWSEVIKGAELRSGCVRTRRVSVAGRA